MIVGPEDAPAGTQRRVILMVPAAPLVGIAIDTPTPDEMGPGRAYQLVALPPGVALKIRLQPSQAIFASVLPGAGGLAQLGYICEFYDEDVA